MPAQRLVLIEDGEPIELDLVGELPRRREQRVMVGRGLDVLFLTVSIYRDVRALSRETRARAAASQERWEQRRTDDEKRDKALHDEILGELIGLTAELRVQRQAIERINQVTPVQAIRDRATVAR